jgi:S1-C subfamily serine protease
MKWTTGPIVAVLLLAAGVCRADSQTETDIRRSVVRILATQRFPNLLKPWMKQEPREITGTGVVIDGQRILTNAHLVTYAKQIYVEPYQSSDKLAATVERLAPGIDVAVLKVEDKTFWKNRPVVPKSVDLPEGKDAVSVYGYPVGGSSLAVTKGKVTDQYVEFDFHEKYVETLVFDRKEVLAAMDDILSDNNIGQPCSADLRAAWQADK